MKNFLTRLPVLSPSTALSRHRERPRSVLGIAAFALLGLVLSAHMIMPLDSGGRYLLSDNRYIEWAGTFALIVAPPAAVVLAFLHWLSTGRIFLSFLTVAIGSFLTAATALAIVMGYIC